MTPIEKVARGWAAWCRRHFFTLSLLVLVGLLVYNGYLVWRGYSSPPPPAPTSQSHWEVTEGAIFQYSSCNREGRPLTYTYTLYLDGQVVAQDTVVVPAGKDFGFGIHLGEAEGKQMRFVLLQDGQVVEDIVRFLVAGGEAGDGGK